MADKELDKKDQEKKIIVDEDWKTQAQKEKDRLAKEEEKEEKTQHGRNDGPLPEGNFAALVSMLVTQALFALGLIAVEGQGKKEPDLALAKYNIDMLETLEQKTKGNLTKKEEKVLADTLGQVRMAYVKLAE